MVVGLFKLCILSCLGFVGLSFWRNWSIYSELSNFNFVLHGKIVAVLDRGPYHKVCNKTHSSSCGIFFHTRDQIQNQTYTV
jgi:hypothetical protein